MLSGKLSIGVVMDPIESINTKKDSTFAMLLAAQRRGHSINYLTDKQIWLENGVAWGAASALTVADDPEHWFDLQPAVTNPLAELDVILMRKDPPFDMEYIQNTYILERAELAGSLLVNRPQALRDVSEKAFCAWFPELTPPTLVARDAAPIKAFIARHQQVVIKPMDGMGGTSIFRSFHGDPNLNVILETVSQDGEQLIMVQHYIEAISAGDKRILLVDGQAVPYALARIPSAEDFRGNLAKGGTGKGVELSQRDWEIAKAVGPELRRRGILFAGIDVIGDYLTEVNVTSPTCIRELDAEYGLDIAGDLFAVIEARVAEQAAAG